MLEDGVELRLGVGGRRVLVVRELAVRRPSGDPFGSVEVRHRFEVRVVPGHRVRRLAAADAMAVARELLGLGLDSVREPRLLERLGFGLNRTPDADEVARALMNGFMLVELEIVAGRWDGPAVARQPCDLGPPAVESVPALTWVAFTVVDDDDPPRPLAGTRFRLRLPDASTVAGALDGDGHARVDDIEPGKCWLELTDLRGQAR
jgi:phosphoribosylformylglycinamidine (FGAM) synthase PurS component